MSTIREKVFKAYELLATDKIDLHMDGLNLLDEARKEDYWETWKVENEISQHKVLQITAQSPKTTIYLADEEENLVQQETGYMLTSVKPGTYYIHFGRKGEKRKINLVKDIQIIE